jgi:hypothetical protein
MRWCSSGGARWPVSFRTFSRRVEVHSMMTARVKGGEQWIDQEGSGRDGRETDCREIGGLRLAGRGI